MDPWTAVANLPAAPIAVVAGVVAALGAWELVRRRPRPPLREGKGHAEATSQTTETPPRPPTR